MRPGPRTQEQLGRLSREWKQGEHVLISGATGSGKTALARHVSQLRVDNGSHVVIMVAKLRPDKTITDDYQGWTRWKKWKKRPAPHENRVLLWPDLKGVPAREALPIQREIFQEAFDEMSKVGKWTLVVDEGLYTCSPTFLNMSHDLAMLNTMGRSSGLTCITLVQRPSHVPLILYSSASHAFIGRAREATDLKRLAELGGRESAKALATRIDGQTRHEFLWIPVAPDWEAETVNLRR